MMKVPWLIILLVAICLLHAGADTPGYPNLDIEKLAGTWYPIAFAYKNLPPKDAMFFDEEVKPTGEGSFLIVLRYMTNEKCEVADISLAPTDKPGVFKISESKEFITIVDVNYESYKILQTLDDADRQLLYLSSRTSEASEEALTKYKDLVNTLGFDASQIQYITKAGKSECGGMFEECTTRKRSIMVLQMILTSVSHI